MRIAIASASAAVTRTLEAIVRAAGHDPVRLKETPDLILRDRLQPIAHSEGDTAQLCLTTTPAAETDIACPIRPLALIQRLQAYAHAQPVVLGHGWVLDPQVRLLTRPHTPSVSLTEKESALLAALARVHPVALARDALLADIWGMTSDLDTHTLETHIYRLRAKLAALIPPPCDILTEDSAYRLEKPAA